MVEYKDTLNLPKTDFEMRAGLATKEPRMLEAWEKQNLYDQVQKARAGRPQFVLHDGPPYANGHLHHGHILNKILKDVVVKDRTMAGFATGFIPGWDCHGLPIEVQVDKELGAKRAAMTKVDVRAACREYADRFVSIQRDEFKRLGVFGRWDEPYRTMSYGYEAQTLRELAKFVDGGLLYKGLRPVNWCMVHQTALAEAEVEYEDHASPSVYVAFTLENLPPGYEGTRPDLVIWTTTPWTLPANVAICLNPANAYIAYPVKGKPRIFAEGLAQSFLAAVGEPGFDVSRVVGRWTGAELAGLSYRHPLYERVSPVIVGEHVTLEAGTGCVHTAPGHGAEDFDMGRRYGLPILGTVDGRGVFTAEAGPFAGKFVFDANKDITLALHECGALLNGVSDSVQHRYAHCWRCHKPIILRATEQWWVAMDKPFAGGGSLRERALAALEEVQWIPHWGEDRIRGMLSARPDWCLSRQRTWGVPIAVVYCEACNHPVLDAEKMRQVAEIFEKQGADAWFALDVKALFGDLRCGGCGGTSFRKENDILDVWFDSGVSFSAVIERERMGPIDLYLEGSDQHRGWFHSSLLCSVATRYKAPFRQVLTHGFVVDGQGKKISKSKGNFVDPFKSIAQDGAELLRLWVVGEDYRDDIRISNEILTRLSDTYRKIRNTWRYFLGNLYDFDPATDSVSELLPLDRYAVALVSRDVAKMRAAYESYTFHTVLQTLAEVCTVDLSAFYLDVLKDRLYASAPKSVERRSAQTALYAIARDLIRIAAPVLCFTAEEAWSHLPKMPGDPASVHLALYSEMREQDPELLARYDNLREVRREVNAALEEARRNKVVGASMEAGLRIEASGTALAVLQSFDLKELSDLLIVSEVEVVPGATPLRVGVVKASGTKCVRCWLYRHDVGQVQAHPTICRRCAEALS